MIDCSLDNEKNKAGFQMRARDRVNARMSRKVVVVVVEEEDSRASLKAGINGLVREASTGIRSSFCGVGIKLTLRQ